MLTASPFLHADEATISEFLPARLPDRSTLALQNARLEIQASLLGSLGDHTHLADYAQPAAMSAMQTVSLAALAATLRAEDIHEPRVAVFARTGSPVADAVVNGPWDRLLSANPNLELREADCSLTRRYNPRGGAPPSFLDRLRLANWRRVAYRAASWIRWLPPARLARRIVWIADENELVQEIAIELLRRGCAIRKVDIPATPQSPLEPADATALIGVVRPLLESAFTPFISMREVLEPLLDICCERVVAATGRYHSARILGERLADDAAIDGRSLILSNFPARADIQGLADAWRRRGAPLFGVQHGVTYEICENHATTYTTYENAVADRSYVFNPAAKRALDEIPGGGRETVIAGAPSDLFRTGPAAKSTRGGPICFVSTAAYHSHSGKFQYGAENDHQMLQRELAILGALGASGHEALYKTYPTLRFLDPDPAKAFAESLENVEIYDGDTDFRFLIDRCRILVTARATSTASWCILSSLPVVYIDTRDSMPLTEDARLAFNESLFLFSTGREGWADDLAAFLARPLELIEKEWAQKSAPRRQMIAEFMSARTDGAETAAKDILKVTADASGSYLRTGFAHDA